MFGRELDSFEPGCGELVTAIGHVFAAEDTKPEHFGRSEVGTEFGIEVAANGLDRLIMIIPLHPIIDCN